MAIFVAPLSFRPPAFSHSLSLSHKGHGQRTRSLGNNDININNDINNSNNVIYISMLDMILAHQIACDNKNPLRSHQQKSSKMQRQEQQQHHIKPERGSAEDDRHNQQQTYQAITSIYHHHHQQQQQPAPIIDHPPPTLMSQARFPQQRQRAYSSGHPIPTQTPVMYSTLPSQIPPPHLLNLPDASSGGNKPQEQELLMPPPPPHFSGSYPLEPRNFHAVLQAPTAITPKTDDVTVTYLNRGQWYVIELTDQHKQHTSPITSTVSIMFHNAAHRRAASNYWKFWLNQQKDVERVRAIDLDSVQSVGIQNIQSSDFDRVTFDWTAHARIYVRFNCLSTDFSRIKGVKGIPLRVQLESGVVQQQQQQQQETEEREGSEAVAAAPMAFEERSFCKIKLFRDKGAERKSKDDAKQMGKQFERIPGGHLWLMHTQPLPYSVFTPDVQDEKRPLAPLPPQQQQQQLASVMGPSSSMYPSMTSIPFPTRHARTMTAPPTYPSWEPCTHGSNNSSNSNSNNSSSNPHPHWSNFMHASAPDYVLSYATVASSPLTASPLAPVTMVSRKRARKDHGDGDGGSFARVPLPPSTYKRCDSHAPLYVRTSSGENQRIDLQEWTVQELKVKLCDILSVYSERVSDVVWRHRGDTSSEFLVLVDEGVIAHHLSSGLTVTVHYEPTQDGSGRLVLQEH